MYSIDKPMPTESIGTAEITYIDSPVGDIELTVSEED
jgi:hypothetical protein